MLKYGENRIRLSGPSLSELNDIDMAEVKQIENQLPEEESINSNCVQKFHSVCFMRRYSAADLISYLVTIAMLIAVAFISSLALKCLFIILAFVALLTPAIIGRFIERNTLSLDYVHKVLAEAGLNPVVADGELHCTFKGKETIIRLYNGGVFQLSREYHIPMKNNLDMYVRAAATTTREVCTVKVGIRRCGDDLGAMVFSAESFCPSAKVFRQIYSGYMQALDVAEQRQGDNLREILNHEDKPRRKIGFITSYSD